MSQLYFGTYQPYISKKLKTSLHDVGIRHIDSADVYGCPEYLGIIKEIPREELWIIIRE